MRSKGFVSAFFIATTSGHSVQKWKGKEMNRKNMKKLLFAAIAVVIVAKVVRDTKNAKKQKEKGIFMIIKNVSLETVCGITSKLPENTLPEIAFAGKSNVGKSSLINKLAQEDRVIVSDIAGTTRDAIDTDIRYNGKEYVFIDTAGLRRKNKIKEEIERYSIIRAVTAVERADVCIIVIDATEGVTEQDAKIAGIAHERGKGIIIAVNKWDAIEKDDKTIYRHTEKIRQILSFMPYAEILFISAKSGQRLNKLFDMIDLVIENNSMRVATGVLNEIVAEAVAMQQPPSDKGKRLKIYYTTQVAVKPPTFVIFVNEPESMHFSYQRYLENKLREAFGFEGTPLSMIIRGKKEDE